MSQAESVQDGPKGLGGWLILPMIGMVLSPLRMAIQFFTDLMPAFKSDVFFEPRLEDVAGHF